MAVTLSLEGWRDVADLIDALHAARVHVGPERAARYLELADELGDAVDSLPDPSDAKVLIQAVVVKRSKVPRIPTDGGRLRVGSYPVVT